MAQQTAVQWLIKEFNLESYEASVKFALEKEKEQIEWAWVNGKISTMNQEDKISQQYYQETYGS